MKRVTFTRTYRMYQSGETAGFSDDEAARLIPAYGYDADDPDAEARKAAKAEEKTQAIAAAEADAKAKAEADAKAQAEADAKAEEDAKAKAGGKAKG